MRFLDRSSVAAPSCLGRYKAGADDWSSLARNAVDYLEVCQQLAALQGARCAYCECDLARDADRPHVEHFRQRSRAPSLTFDWANLFRSCTHEDRCGKHKDRVASTYAHGDILKPDVDRPRQFLLFASDGAVSAREGLDVQAARRATETIRVFRLDSRGLVGTRRSYLEHLEAELSAVASAGLSESERREYLQGVAADYLGYPFSSAVLDVLGL